MRRLLTFLVILLLCAHIALAQDKKIVVVGKAEPPKAAGSAATPAKTPTPTAGAPPSTTTTEPVYAYAGTGTQLMFSTTELGDADKPAGWTKMSLVQVYNVPSDAVDKFLVSVKDYDTKPSAVYDGKIVFANDQGMRILDGPYVYEYDANGKVTNAYATRDTGEEMPADIERRAAQVYQEGFSQFGSLSNTLGTFVQYYRIYAGLSGWSSLIFDKEFLAEWREKVNFVMCDMLSLPTQQCWTSKICDKYTDIGSSQAGVAFAAGAGGVPQAFAHIEAQRSLPIITPNQTSWVYTVTFGLRNPSDEDDMKYNVNFKGPKRSALWWPETQTLGKKASVSVLGAGALMKLTLHEYTEVCLEFDPGIHTPGSTGLMPNFDFSQSAKVNEICNSVVQYAGGATAPYPVAISNATNETTAAGATPSAPGTPGGSV